MRDIPLIIDDVASASTSLTPLGREVVGPAAAAVQAALHGFAVSKGWELGKLCTNGSCARG